MLCITNRFASLLSLNLQGRAYCVFDINPILPDFFHKHFKFSQLLEICNNV